MYHLHVAPVPENGNCTATLAHLDPFDRPESPICDPKLPQTCQVGDLSGKHAEIPEGQAEYHTSYVDLYASTLEGIGAFFGNRSIVFHYANKTRVSCASFEKVADATSHLNPSGECVSGGAKPSGSANTTLVAPKPTGGPSPPTATTAAGTSLKASVAGVVAFAAAITFLL